VTAVVVASLMAASPAAQAPALPIEREAARVLAVEAPPFATVSDLADRLHAALANPAESAETRGRLALLWVRAMRRTLATIPNTIDGSKQEPYQSWLAAHEASAFYAEPAGEWILPNEALWELHDQVRQTTSADELAWQVVDNGLSGECEGYPPCYLSGIDLLEAEYLRRHPRGAHVAEAVERIRSSNAQSVALVRGSKRHEFFNPTTDCVDLVPKADAVRAAVVQSGADGKAAVELIDVLRALCPK
jgi:hypothetical protein